MHTQKVVAMKYIFPRYVKDFVFFPPLIGIAIFFTKPGFSTSTLVAIIVNLFAISFTFLINDIEDRNDDSKNPNKRFLNPFSHNLWSLNFGYAILYLIILYVIFLSYYYNGIVSTFLALSIVVIGWIYSWSKIRLKSLPILDVVSHAYFLAAATMLYFAILPGSQLQKEFILVLVAVTVFSIRGDLENELRDFDEDRIAGLKNTANMIGKQKTFMLSNVLKTTSVLLLIFALVYRYLF